MMPNPWIILAIVLAWGGSLVGVGVWQRHDGALADNDAWQIKANKEQIAATAKIKSLEDAARHKEQTDQAAFVAISTNYEGQLQNANKQHEADLNALHAGTLVLRDHGTTGLRPIGCSSPETAGSTSGRDDSQGRQLSLEADEFLFGFADEADNLANQLTACQAIVTRDRLE